MHWMRRRWPEIMTVRLTLLALLLFMPPCGHALEKADRVLVEKSKHRLSLYQGKRLIASFHVMFGGNPVGHKMQEGDGKTPEGQYLLDFKKANSQYYKAIHVSYPNKKDMASARRRGVSPGGDIMIHGQRNGFGWAAAATQKFNWTLGCIALTNEDLDQVWRAVDRGTPIEIVP